MISDTTTMTTPHWITNEEAAQMRDESRPPALPQPPLGSSLICRDCRHATDRCSPHASLVRRDDGTDDCNCWEARP